MMLAGVGLVVLAGYAALLFFQPFNRNVSAYLAVTSAQHLVLGLLFWRLRRAGEGTSGFVRSALLVLFGAAMMRALLFTTAPTLSDDVYRFVWDGRVQAAGINPYVYAPADPALSALRDADHGLINHPHIRTIYPPLCEWAYRLGVALLGGPAGQKLLFGVVDLCAVAVLLWVLRFRRRSAGWAALYAWNPVTVVEFAGSGHNDSLMLLFVIAAIGLQDRAASRGAALSLAGATLSKWIPAVAIPWLLLRRAWRPVALYGAFVAVALGWFAYSLLSADAPVIDATSGARTFARDWVFNASLYDGMGAVVDHPVHRKIVIGAALVVFAFWWARRTPDLARYLFGVTLALLLAGPVVHPWYLSWLAPFASVLGSAVSLVWMWAASLSYIVQIRYAAEGVWSLPPWVPAVEYALVYGTLGVVGLRRLRRPRPPITAPAPLPSPTVSVVIPALNEEKAISAVIADIPAPLVREVIVVDNGSSDRTPEVAAAAGARVVRHPVRGYGGAVQAGVRAAEKTDVIVVLDGDRSDFPEELEQLLAPIRRGEAHLVIGSRTEAALPGSLMPQQRFGNWLTCALIDFLYGHRYSDMGPFRAVRRDAYDAMGMEDMNFGWNVEMQVKALQLGLAVVEVPVRYRPRIGQSKISGTLRGSFHAGRIILWAIHHYAFRRPARQACEASSR